MNDTYKLPNGIEIKKSELSGITIHWKHVEGKGESVMLMQVIGGGEEEIYRSKNDDECLVELRKMWELFYE